MSPFNRTFVLGLALFLALQLVSFVSAVTRSASEQSGPLVAKTVDSTLARYHPSAGARVWQV